MGDDGKVTDVLHKRKGTSGALVSAKSAPILAVFAQVFINFGEIEMVVTKLPAICRKNGDPLAVARFEQWIAIDVDHVDDKIVQLLQLPQSAHHIVAKVTVAATIDGERARCARCLTQSAMEYKGRWCHA